MRASCSAGVSPSGDLDGNAGAQLALEAGDANHEELVEIVGGDGEEADPFEQRMGVVVRLLEHPAVELEPRQLAIDEPLRAGHEVECRRGLVRGRQSATDFVFLSNNLAASAMARMLHLRGSMAAIR